VSQDPVTYPETGNSVTYTGLVFTGSSIDFGKEEMEINQNPIDLGDEMTITTTGGLGSFSGIEDDTIKYNLTAELTAERFKILHLDNSGNRVFNPTTAFNFPLGDMTTWIKEVTFNDGIYKDGLGISLNFSEIPAAGITLDIDSPQLRLNEGKPPLEVIKGEKLIFTDTLIKTFDPTAAEFKNGLDFDITIGLPSVDVVRFPNLIELEEVVPGDKLRLYGEPDLVFDWATAKLNLNTDEMDELDSRFPGTGADGIDLSDIVKFIGDLKFNNIKGYLYASGLEVSPLLQLKADYTNRKQVPDSRILRPESKLDILPNNPFKLPPKPLEGDDTLAATPDYTGLEEIEDLLHVFNETLSDLYLYYELNMEGNTVPVRRQEIDNVEDKAFRADFYIEISLAFDIPPEGAAITIEDMFTEDIFGRKNKDDDDIFGPLGLDSFNSLQLTLDLENGTGMDVGKFLLVPLGSDEPLVELDLNTIGPQTVTFRKGEKIDDTDKKIDDLKQVPLIPEIQIRFPYKEDDPDANVIGFDWDGYIKINKLAFTTDLEYEQDL
jgi:hypothetical protein